MNGIIQFYTEHQAVLSAAFIALIDLLYAINPNTQSSGLLHSIYAFFGGKK